MAIRTLARSLIAVAVAATSIVASPASAGSHPPGPDVVRVDSGWLRGSVTDDHVSYSAIPYAAPPVGERRWRPPVRPRPWSGVRDATTPSTPCPTWGTVGAADCLYLDVTLPRGARPGKRLPVLVWLHGGGFVTGSAQEYDGARLATAGDMVVVTINYRLGLPQDVLDAARADGASAYRIFLRVVVPMVKPALAVLAIIFSLEQWNDLLWPLIIMRSEDNYPLSVGISTMVGIYRPRWDLVMTASVVAVVPILVLFFALRKMFIGSLGQLGTGGR